MASILIVDDDLALLKQFQASLSDLADVRVARRAADVQRLCRQAEPDLLLLDLQLGDGDGLDVLKALKSDNQLAAIPVMFVSGEQDGAPKVHAYELDVVDWLSKPVDEARLRARVASALRRAQAPSNVLAVPAPPADRRGAILLVDDDPIIRDALASALSGDDVDVHAAADAAQALEHIATRPPDVVLLDIRLPTIDGFQLAERLQAMPALVDVPIIFVTQCGDVASEVRALELGAFDFVGKPFMPAVLRARVRNALRQRHRARAMLQRAERHWQRVGSEQISAIVAHARDAIISVDEDGRVVLANRSARLLMGEADLPLDGLALPPWLANALPAALRDGTREHVDGVALRPPGRQALICDVSAQVDATQGRRLVTLTLKDQTQHLQAEAEARENLRLQAESRTKQLMMSYLAHEIGNPLNGVVNLTALLLAPGADPLTPEQERRLRLVGECAGMLQRLMTDALDLARLEAGQFSLRLERLSVRDAVCHAVDALQPAAAATQVTLQAPRGDLDAQVLADGMRLRQCLHNLVSNACKYGRAGGCVAVDVLDSGDEVAIAVSDDGPGLAPEQLRRLFEPFERLGRHGSAGHGLGLAVTRTLVQAMGGRVDVSSAEGLGSRFTLMLRKPAASEGGAK
ncbi:MAG: hypothetical protein RLZZ598_1804 [Pseudomonadota bacterium]|jgi:signal transduction histidine kinase